MLAHGARVLTDGVYPFFSDRMNYPDGVNMMANTSVLAVSLPMTPITLLFGPHVAFNVFLTLALAVTGISWYLVLSRMFVSSRLAAWVIPTDEELLIARDTARIVLGLEPRY